MAQNSKDTKKKTAKSPSCPCSPAGESTFVEAADFTSPVCFLPEICYTCTSKDTYFHYFHYFCSLGGGCMRGGGGCINLFFNQRIIVKILYRRQQCSTDFGHINTKVVFLVFFQFFCLHACFSFSTKRVTP